MRPRVIIALGISLIDRQRLRLGFLFVALSSFAFLSAARAVNPAPDGGYAGDNTAEGDFALDSLTTGTNNTAIGFHALISNDQGSDNTAVGFGALVGNITGEFNTATGSGALFNNKGSFNTATGFESLGSNLGGEDNTAMGGGALFNNVSGNFNTATGFNALFGNTSAIDNTATGGNALENNTANYNTGTGFDALVSNTSGTQNTATGVNALRSNTIANYNTADGTNALYFNSTGTQEVASGVNALFRNTSGNYNTADGVNALYSNTSGSNNTAVGNAAGYNLTTGSNNIDIGNRGVAAEANTIRIGATGVQQATFIAGISGKTVAGGVAVMVDTNGHIGTMTSSARFKQAVKPMDTASKAILGLKPVTFRYRDEIDPNAIPQFGLVAEEVEKIAPELVVRDDEGKPYAVRYEAVNAMLLNEFLKAHRQLQQQEAAITQQQEQIKTLAAKLEKVSTQLPSNNPDLGN